MFEPLNRIDPVPSLSRRQFVGGAVLVSGVMLAACGRSTGAEQTRVSRSGPAEGLAMTVYRDPSCGCCEAWAKLAEDAGYTVQLIDRPDMPALKTRLGVPEALASCHTATVGGYVIEGHVPFDAVDRLIKSKSKSIRGIAVAGMPRGAPGMEMPDGSKDQFEVMAFDASGTTSRFDA